MYTVHTVHVYRGNTDTVIIDNQASLQSNQSVGEIKQ